MNYFWFGLFGLFFGLVLSFVGFTDYGELHRMFVFADLRMFFTFAGAVALSALAFQLLPRKHPSPKISFHPGIFFGGILFGIGWSLCGGCPAIPLVQLGEGYVPAIATIVGLILGLSIYPRIHRRFFRWDPGTCGE